MLGQDEVYGHEYSLRHQFNKETQFPKAQLSAEANCTSKDRYSRHSPKQAGLGSSSVSSSKQLSQLLSQKLYQFINNYKNYL